MTRSIKALLFIAWITMLAPTVAYADERPDPQVATQMSLGDAKSLIQKWKMFFSSEVSADTRLDVAEFTPKQIRFVAYFSPPSTALICPYETLDPYVASTTQVNTYGPHKGEAFFSVYSGRHNGKGCFVLAVGVPDDVNALQVAAAMLRWKNSTIAERQALPAQERQAFASVVATYQASNPRPQIPEDVRRFSVIAESAIQDKRLSDAVNAFEDGLKLAPWWPEGHFNDALVLGQLHYYDEAIDHMQKYILLAPNAPDARKAQDQIYTWQGEVQALWPTP